MTGLGAGLRDLAASATSAVDVAVNETLIRLAVTGLSRAGKTVFITSLIRNLLALGQGRGTLPQLQVCLETGGTSRLKHVRILPAGAATIPSFDYSEKFAELASETPSWPPRTDDLAQIALDIEVERNGTFWRKLGPRRIRLEILDYPGEWLLDLPLLTRSYAAWSQETLALLRRPPRDAVFAEFLAFLNSVDVHGPVDDELIQRGHVLYRHALHECRERFGLRYLQPGRFLRPGPRSDAPFMWFFPMGQADTQPARGTAGALLRDRYEAYKTDMRATFFDTHFANFDRQVVLVDVLGALHAGKEAFEDTARVIADIAASMSYGGNLPRPVHEIGATALRVGGQLLGRHVFGGRRAADAISQAVQTRRIERVAFVATKADHVPAMRRDNLCNLLRALAEPAQDKLGRGPVTYHAAAAVLSTEDGTTTIEGRPVEVVFGVPLGEERARPFYPGDVPSARPRDSFWSNRYFELPVFTPPRLDATGATGIPHLGLDEVLNAVLKGVL
jgi:predicted YcjX-like family ATPase